MTTVSKLDASSAHDEICKGVHLSCKKTNSCVVNTASTALQRPNCFALLCVMFINLFTVKRNVEFMYDYRVP